MLSSKMEIEAVQSAQLIANTLPKLDKPGIGAISPRKSRRTPKLKVECDDRAYRHSDLVLFDGDHEAALLYAQIRYWSGTGKNGKSRASIEIKGRGRGWIAKSAEMLWDELMLTEDQVRRINSVFKTGNAVEVETAMYKRSKCTHYRYVSSHAQGGTLPENPESHSGKKPNHTPGKPHVFTETMTETDSETENIQEGAAGNTAPEPTPEILKAESGKGKTPNKEKASEPFLQILLKQKREFIKLNDNGENTPCVLPELTPDDLNTAQRLEYELSKAGIDPLAFANWLTPTRFQHIALIDLDNGADWTLFVVMSHRDTFFDKFRTHLADNAKFSSAQQIKLCTMAPAGKKPLIPLYEQDLDVTIGMFSWDAHWLENQEGGDWGGCTRLEHLRKFSRYVPEMEGWLDNEALLAHVLELQGGTKHQKAA